MKRLLWGFDRWLERRLVSDDVAANERDFHLDRETAKGTNSKDLVSSVLHDMNSLNDKSAALLQYISLMIAALTFAAQKLTGPGGMLVEFVVYTYLGLYLACALLLLRCLNIMGPIHMDVPDAAAYTQVVIRETSLRRRVYIFVLRVTFGLTIVGIVLAILGAIGFVPSGTPDRP